MSSLFKINKEIEELVQLNTNEETGEIDTVIWDDLDRLEMGRREKILNVGHYIRNLRSEAEQHKMEKARQAHLSSVYTKRAEKLESYLVFCMKKDEAYKDTSVDIKFSTRPSVEIDAKPEDFPEEYVNKKTSLTVNKEKLLEALNNKVLIPGARIKYNLLIK